MRRGADLNELGIISDGALLIRDGKLLQVNTSRRVESLLDARGAFEINAAGRVVMPGFVDSHTHLVFPSPDCPDAAREKAVHDVRTSTAKRLAARARHHLDAMARHGTTTVEAKTGCGPDDRAEIKLLRVLDALGKGPAGVVPSVLLRMPAQARDEESLARETAEWYARALLPKVRRRKQVCFADLAWEPCPRVHESLQLYLRAARGQGFALKLHADQDRCAEAVAMAAENLAVSVDHLEHATPSQAGLLAASQTIATFTPYPCFHRGGAVPPARALIEAGVPVALASDFTPHHTPNLNMQTVVALACREMGLTPAEALSAATINGAHALNCADWTGSLEPGKAADVVILNTSDYREMADHFGTNLVHLTMKRGEFIYKEGEVAKLKVEELEPAS